MPQRKSAKEELKKSTVRQARNITRKKTLKASVKAFKRSLDSQDIDAAQGALKKLYKALDRTASKNLIHPNKASRKKSRFAAQLNAVKAAPSK